MLHTLLHRWELELAQGGEELEALEPIPVLSPEVPYHSADTPGRCVEVSSVEAAAQFHQRVHYISVLQRTVVQQSNQLVHAVFNGFRLPHLHWFQVGGLQTGRDDLKRVRNSACFFHRS